MTPRPAPGSTQTSAPPFSLSLLAELLRRTERERGLIAARRLARRLDYARLTALARQGIEAEEADNDPSLLDPRHLFLFGMRGPEVARFQRALCTMGYRCAVTGVFDAGTLERYRSWRETVLFGKELS